MNLDWRSNLLNRVRVLIIYAIFGPLIGAIIFSFFLATFLSGLIPPTEPGWGAAAKDALRVLWYIAQNGYAWGGLQAMLAGLIICLFADRAGRFGYWTAFWGVLPPSILGGVFIGGTDGADSINIAATLIALSVVSSLLVRLLFGKIFRPARQR